MFSFLMDTLLRWKRANQNESRASCKLKVNDVITPEYSDFKHLKES